MELELATRFSGVLAAGPTRRLALDAAELPSGSYLVRVVGEHETTTQMATL